MSGLSNEISNESCAEISSRARTWSQSKSVYNMRYNNSWQIGYAHEGNLLRIIDIWSGAARLVVQGTKESL